MAVIDQELLFKQLQTIFHNVNIHKNVRNQSQLKYPTTGGYMELDFWIPTHDICFEFQDAYHYVSSWFYQSPKAKIQQKDNWKQTKVHQINSNLIIVPCWWDGTVESLCSTISFQRPDLNLNASQPPISLNSPTGFLNFGDIPGVGELMLASFPDDIKNSTKVQWWMGEKYDGIRVCWNSNESRLYMRSGNCVNILPSMEKLMPDSFVDAEIWFGRDNFSMTSALLHSTDHIIYWPLLRIISFDVPSRNSQDQPFEFRYKLLDSFISLYHPYILIAWRALCFNNTHINMFLQNIVNNSGEGVILRQRNSLYINGRNQALVKMKVTNFNEEGIVIQQGLEKEGSPKSVFLKLPNGTVLNIPPQHILIPTPSIGDVVSFSFERHAQFDVPVNPKIFRVRYDVSWQDVVYNSYRETQYRAEIRLQQGKNVLKAIGGHVLKKLRMDFESFASSRGLDPLLAKTWYNIPFKTVSDSIDKAIKEHFGGNYFNALQQLFPEISFNKNIFFTLRTAHLSEVRRNFFESFAERNNFDPLVASNWYSQNKKSILATEGISKILKYHEGSISKALLDLFPDVHFDKNFLQGLASWDTPESRRSFFEQYSQNNGFDPLVATNWYSQSRKKILSTPGAKEVISYHGNSVSRALLDLFPNTRLNISTLQNLSSWRSVKNRRHFFENYAIKNEFDYLNADAWYSQSRTDILSVEGARKILLCHGGSVAQALLDLFPDVVFDPKTLHNLSPWNSKSNRRAFFEKYARDHGFDPLNPFNWYSQPTKRIISVPGGRSVMMHHSNSPTKALVDLFPEIQLDPDRLRNTHKF